MSVRVMARIWDDFPGDGPELLAMLAMGNMANDEGHCWPSMATIAKKIRRSRSQAQRVLHSLIEQGFIVVTDNVNGGAPGTTRRYRIVVERLTGRTDATPGDEPETTEADCKTGRTDATGSAGATGRTDATGRMDAQDGSHGCDGRGRMDATQTIIETSGTVIPSAPASPAPDSRGDCEKSEPSAELFLIDQMAKAARVPSCPTREIVALYRKHLPMLPQPRLELLKGSDTETAIKERWKWLLTATRETGERYATNTAEGLDWFDRFFEQVSESDFLTGRNGGWGKADLGWQMKYSNFRKIVQGNYINRTALAA